MTTHIERLKAEIDPDGLRKLHGHELHALIDRAARARMDDHWAFIIKIMAEHDSELPDRASYLGEEA